MRAAIIEAEKLAPGRELLRACPVALSSLGGEIAVRRRRPAALDIKKRRRRKACPAEGMLFARRHQQHHHHVCGRSL